MGAVRLSGSAHYLLYRVPCRAKVYCQRHQYHTARPLPARSVCSFIIGLFLAPAIQSLCENHHNFLLYSLGTRMRNALMAAIYRKCLRLSSAALQVRLGWVRGDGLRPNGGQEV